MKHIDADSLDINALSDYQRDLIAELLIVWLAWCVDLSKGYVR